MLSVSESADMLGVSGARIRALIKSGSLPAVKNGHAWVLREEDVLQRLAIKPHAGRPKAERRMGSKAGTTAESGSSKPGLNAANVPSNRPHDIYKECRALFRHIPSAGMISQAHSEEEAAFYMAVADFFLQQEQARLVKAGVY